MRSSLRTELHFHLLPGVDDGPVDDDEAIELARLAVADGTARIVVTRMSVLPKSKRCRP